MRCTKKDTSITVTALLISGLILSFFLVLITDGARLFTPKNADRMRAEILLENLDAAVANALASEIALSPDGGAACPVLHIDEVYAQPRSTVTSDGRILLLPSGQSLCTKITLEIAGRHTEDGFLAFGNRRWMPGTRIRLCGKRTACEGLILSLTPIAP